jgi:hypothetical protein
MAKSLQIAYFNRMNDKPKSAADELFPLGTVMGTVPRCPICGHQSWTKIVPPDLKEGEAFQDLVTGIRGQQQLVGLETKAFVCEVCGFVRQHYANVYKP